MWTVKISICYFILGLVGFCDRVFTTSIVRVAFVDDFFDLDMTWALRKVYICTIVERNLAEFIADLPAVFPLIRSLHRKAITIITQSSRNNNKSESHIFISNPTIGSAKRFNGPKRGEFAAYGENGQFTTIRDESDDEIPLKDDPHRPTAALKRDRSITVQVNIDIESQERMSKGPLWSAGSLRPEL